MKYIPSTHSAPLSDELGELLTEYREMRKFDAKTYVASKVELINKYFASCKLHTGLVALSGGIDSAVVAALLKAAVEDDPDNGIRAVKAVTMPALTWDGVTDQEGSRSRAEEVAIALDLDFETIDMTPLSQTAVSSMSAIGTGTDWSHGQLTPYLRTASLYYITALLTDAGTPGIVCGTTNLDEGGYLGYIGKASDGMVDIQVISDLHKSEVYAVARYLGLPDVVLDVTPKGDMVGGRTDEDIFGAPYDMVELSRPIINQGIDTSTLSLDAAEELAGYMTSLLELAVYNSHKYTGNGAGLGYAVSLHVLPCDVAIGWNPKKWESA